MPIGISHREGPASPGKRSAGSTAASIPAAQRKLKRVSANAPAPSSAAGPDLAEVARLAYSYWESRGNARGSAEEDWLRAERELRRASVTNI